MVSEKSDSSDGATILTKSKEDFISRRTGLMALVNIFLDIRLKSVSMSERDGSRPSTSGIPL